ncbi:MAG: hypothetical protein EA397_16245 [Deltaproteobacteria bacterium]|nr:MAG: hypothetical protein EA397_16245 [Deltaproteobacteria bacterium]
MVRIAWLSLVLIAGCEVVEPRGSVLEPVRDAAAARSSGSAASDGSADGFDFDAYKKEQAEADGEAAPEEPDALLEQLGAEDMEVPDDLDQRTSEPEPEPAPAASPPTPAQASPAPPSAVPQERPFTVVDTAMGVRLVSTLNGTSPPRAVIGLNAGEERVVKAGDMIPEAGVVVLSIGRDLVQLAEVRSQGDHATIQSVFLQSMLPGQGSRD